MLRRKKTKTATLIFVISITVLYVVGVDPMSIGLYVGCPAYCHFTWPFFHASWLHLIINAWCLLGIVFLYDVSPSAIAVAYLSSVVAPNMTYSPTIGISGICFFLMGYIMWQTLRKLYFNSYIAVFILIGFIFSGGNNMIHIYSYVLGVSYGYLCRKL